MVFPVIAMISLAVILTLAVRANARFRGEARLPMQWDLAGEVTWSAPRHMALAFMPVLASGSFVFLLYLARNVAPRPGQEHLVLPMFAGTGVTLVAIQLLHHWMIAKALRRDAG
ncbi:hypothetical protein LPN01_07980 [Sphingomonas sp. A2-49]|uniref:hypothetical protein n=1 Tax=Sphingomonas sp. A2-49 TaxID=1391375 RepID=UPI0021CF2FF5|nr:hypothetical protein [Sphingomonas sp. A2-49]MCU6454012.1 hypothetical protein [Sphingomonas sp. A2-49]